MYSEPSDLGSLTLFQIIPKDHTQYYIVLKGTASIIISPGKKQNAHYFLFRCKSIGSKDYCQEKQVQLEKLCQTLCNEEEDNTVEEEENASEQDNTYTGAQTKRKGNAVTICTVLYSDDSF